MLYQLRSWAFRSIVWTRQFGRKLEALSAWRSWVRMGGDERVPGGETGSHFFLQLHVVSSPFCLAISIKTSRAESARRRGWRGKGKEVFRSRGFDFHMLVIMSRKCLDECEP
jgi:hypothetical protein